MCCMHYTRVRNHGSPNIVLPNSKYWAGRTKSKEHKIKISAGLTNKKQTEETKLKRVEALKKVIHTPEWSSKISAAKKGYKCSEVTKAKMSISKIGKPAHNKGTKMSAESRKKMSFARIGKELPKQSRGRRTEYNGIIFRSTYEARMARALDALNLKWEYEKKWVDLGECCYVPDFYVPAIDSYIETKGWMDERSIRKIKLFKEKYPDQKFILATLPVIESFEKGDLYGSSSLENLR